MRVIPNACALVEQEPEFMAEMIPDRLPSGASAGEKRVFEAPQRLPDNCIVYYEPVAGKSGRRGIICLN